MTFHKITPGEHWNLTGQRGEPLKCASCGVEQTIRETEFDSLMHTDGETIECDACNEARWAWPLEVAASQREEADFR